MAISILVLAGIIILVWTGLRTPGIQNTLAQQIIHRLSKTLDAEISSGKIRYKVNNSLVIRDLLIKDKQKDTLLFVHRLEAKIQNLDYSEKQIALNKLLISDLYFKGEKYKDTSYNFTFITEKLFKKPRPEFVWKIQCTKIDINNSRFKANLGVKEQHHLEKFHLQANNIYVDSANIGFNMDEFSFNYNNKPFLEQLGFSFRKNKNNLEVNGLNLQLQESLINIPEALVKLPNGESNFSYTVKVNSSNFNPQELSPLLSDLKDIDFPLEFASSIIGSNEEFKAHDLLITFGEQTILVGELSGTDLNKKGAENFYFSIDNLITDYNDISYITHEILKKDTANLPPQLKSLGDIIYKGKLYGESNTLLTHGILTTNLGNLNTRLKLEQVKDSAKLNIEGKLSANPVNLYPITNNDMLGKVNMQLETQGYISKIEGVQLAIEGVIKQIEFNQTLLQDINFNGNIRDKMFSGKINSKDPNFRFDFDGLISRDTLPIYDFKSSIYYANLYKLGFDKKDSTTNLSAKVDANFRGNNLDNSFGEVSITDVFLFKDSSYFATDSIKLKSSIVDKTREIHLESEYLSAILQGEFNSKNLYYNLKSFLGNQLPALKINTNSNNAGATKLEFDVIADYPGPITDMFLADYRISPGTQIHGSYNSEGNVLNITGSSDKITFKNRHLLDIELKAFTRDSNLFINVNAEELNYANSQSLKNFLASTRVKTDSIGLNINWNNWLDVNYSGNINSLISLKPTEYTKYPLLKIDLFPSNIILVDTLWEVQRSSIEQDSSGFIFNNFGVNNGRSKVNLEGTLSNEPQDSLMLTVEAISLSHLNVILKDKPLKYNGLISGNVVFHELSESNKIDAEVSVENLSLNKKIVGNTYLSTQWNKDLKQLEMLGYNELNRDTTIKISGYVSPLNKYMDVTLDIAGHPLGILEAFLSKTFSNIEGNLNGALNIYGETKSPKWYGAVMAENAAFILNPTHTYYTFNDTVRFNNHDILFNQIEIKDKDGNNGMVNGIISNEALKYFDLDLDIETDKLLCLDSKYEDNPLYHGSVYASGLVDIFGPSKNLNIDIVATTLENSKFVLPLEGKGEIEDNDFVTFTNPQAPIIIDSELQPSSGENQLAPQTSTNISMDLTITQDTDIEIIMDSRVGDALSANGDAKLNIVSKGKEFNIYGDYTIYKGDFIFTLQNVINKRFEIEQGSSVSWTGDPVNAAINVDAIYKIRRASVYDLTLDEKDKENKVDVDLHLFLTEALSNPNINFNVNVPATTNNEAIDQLNSLPSDDLNKQVISLLLINRFAPLPGLTQTTADNFASGALTATTASELLSNQLSSWLSQITSDVDLGFTYRPGEEGVTQEEYEFALSTRLWNDRVIFNGNVGYSGQQAAATNQNAYTTDFTLEFKLNKKGNVRLTAFQKVNNDITIDYAPYTQGIGLFFTEEFNHFDDLLHRMFRKSAAQKPKETTIEEEK